MHTTFGSDGETANHTVIVTQRDEEGKVTGGVNIVTQADGSKTETTNNPDGSRTEKKYDADGKLVSEKTYPSDEDTNDFWDPVPIYGDHPDRIHDVDMVSDMQMILEVDPSLEAYVDHFDFVM